MIGIERINAYIPYLRLPRKSAVEANSWFSGSLRGLAKGHRTFCSWDEDVNTLGAEAARLCLTGTDRKVGNLYLASTSAPFDDRSNVGVIATALQLGEGLSTLETAGSQKVGTSTLMTALRGVENSVRRALVVASDVRRTKTATPHEVMFGDGAAAVLVGSENVIAEYLGGVQTSVDFVDHYKGAGFDHDYYWEERWIREEGYVKLIADALGRFFAETGVRLEEVDQVVLPGFIRGASARILKAAGLDGAVAAHTYLDEIGECGTAHPLLCLAGVLETSVPGRTILVVGWGQGCDVLAFRTTEALADYRPGLSIKDLLAQSRIEDNYSKFLAFREPVPMDHGIRAENDRQTALSALYRNRDMILGFVGGKCGNCGTPQYPKTHICVNPNCRAKESQTPYSFADKLADVQSWTADNLTYTPDPPHYFGVINFHGGGRHTVDFADVSEGDLDEPRPVKVMFRIKEIDAARGFRKYFWKATPHRLPAVAVN